MQKLPQSVIQNEVDFPTQSTSALQGQSTRKFPQKKNWSTCRVLFLGYLFIGVIALFLVGAITLREQNHHMNNKQIIQQAQSDKKIIEQTQAGQLDLSGDFKIVNTYDISIKASKDEKISQFQYYESIQSEIISISLYNSPSSDVCYIKQMLLNEDLLGKKDQMISQIIALIQSQKNQGPVIYQLAAYPELQISQLQSKLKQIISNRKFQIQRNKIQADYQFIKNPVRFFQCEWICYGCNTSDTFIQNQSTMLLYSKHQKIDLNSVDISNLTVQQLQQFSFAFSQKLLNFITPLNFAYNNFYQYSELFLFPLLALLQSTQSMQATSSLKIKQLQFGNYPQYQLSDLPEKNQHICFLSLPSNPSSNNVSETLKYLSTFPEQEENQINISFIVSFLYSLNQQLELSSLLNRVFQIGELHKEVYIKFRIRKGQIEAGLQVYDSVYSYCPFNSVIFSSRVNIIPNYTEIIRQIQINNLCQFKPNKQGQEKMNMVLIPNYYQPDEKKSNLLALKPDPNKKHHPYSDYYDTHFKHAQIFCSHLVRSSRIDDFKWQQTQFYETELAYFVLYFESCQQIYAFSNSHLFRLNYIRNYTEKQVKQIQGLKFRNFKQHRLPKHPSLDLIKFSSLNNKALKRNAPNIIPKVIHQIWLIDDPKAQLSEVRTQLTRTLLRTNPDFKYALWKKQDITRENFPITYDALLKLMGENQKKSQNFYSVVADVMRIQILYHHGGVYCDLKVQGRKSLEPFLKYTQFWFEVLFGKGKGGALTNGIIGSIPYHERFKTILTQYFQPNNVSLPKAGQHIYSTTGSTRLVLAYPFQQLVVDILCFGPFLAGNSWRPCLNEGLELEFDSDQKIFQGKNQKNQKYKIGIPCKVNPEKYLELYRSLGRSYFNGKDYKR